MIFINLNIDFYQGHQEMQRKEWSNKIRNERSALFLYPIFGKRIKEK